MAAATCFSLAAGPIPAEAAIGDRIGGQNRYDTAALVSQTLNSCSVVVANGQSFPDGLAGAVFGFPILLTEADGMPDETVADLQRLATLCGGELAGINVLDGTAAVSPAVFDELKSYSPANTKRLGGANRYETAIAVAEDAGPGGTPVGNTVLMATGQDFADALAAGTLAAGFGFPIILNDGDTLRPDVGFYLLVNNIKGVIILGGAAAVPESIEDELADLNISSVRRAGADRFETAAEIAATSGFTDPSCALIVNGNAFADALAAGPFGGAFGCPIVLVQQHSVPGPTQSWLNTNAANLNHVFAIGGTAVVGEAVLALAVAAAT